MQGENEAPLGIAASPTKHHHRISCQLIQDTDQVAVFILARYEEVALLKLLHRLVSATSEMEISSDQEKAAY